MSATFKSKKSVYSKLLFDSCKANKFSRKLKKSFKENSFIVLAWQHNSYLVALLLFFSDMALSK